MSNLLPLEERERRLRVMEDLVKTESWKIICQSLDFVNYVEMQNVVDLHWEGKHDEAKILALKVKAKQEVVKEPMTIVNRNKTVFDEWNGKDWVRRVKKIFAREGSNAA